MPVTGHKFFITGFPRMRSAWFANWFTTGPIRCLHDGTMGLESLAQYYNRLQHVPAPIVGDANSAIPFFWDQLAERYNNPPIVLIVRPVDEVMAFGKKIGRIDWILPLKEAIEDLSLHYPVKVVPYYEIEDRLQEIWEYCVGQHTYDEDRTEMLSKLNVQADISRYADKRIIGAAQHFMRSI